MRYRTHNRTTGEFVDPYVPDAETNGGLGIRYVGPGAVAKVPIQVPAWSPYVDGDIVELLWDGNQLARRVMFAQDSDKVLQFDIDPNDIRQYRDGEHLLVAQLTLVVSGDTKVSESVPVWVKTTPPGGIDPEPDTTTINEKLATPTVRPDPPTDDLDNVRVAFPMYENAAVGDKLTVSWQGRFIPVPPAQPVPLTPDDLTKAEFEIVVPRAVIEDAGGGDDVPISYRIIDRVNNSSLWAPYLRQSVPIEDPNAPTAPWVEGTVNDDGLVFDLIAHGKNDVTVTVYSHGGSGTDQIHVHWAGTAADAKPVPAYDTERKTVLSGGRPMTFTIPYEQARILGEGSVEVTYVVHHANGTTITSRRRIVAIKGQAVSLLPPFVADAADAPVTVIDAAKHKGGALMIAPLQPELIPDGSKVTFTWAGVDSGNAVVSAIAGRITRGLLPYASILKLVGTTVRIHYQVDDFITATDSATDTAPKNVGVLRISDSDWITLSVIDSDAAAPELPPPSVPEVDKDTNILDPILLAATLTIPAPTPARASHVTALIAANVPFSQTTVILNPAQPPSFALDGRDFIQPNDGSKAIATYILTGADGYVASSGPYEFTIGQVTPALPPPTVDEADGINLDPLKAANGVTVRIPAALQPGDTVVVHFGTWNSASLPWNTGMGVPVPASEIAKLLGKGVDVTYTVNGSIDSPPLTLNVGDFSNGDVRLPMPAINEASGDTLDLRSFTGPAHANLPPWPLMAEGQRIWLRVTWPGGQIALLTGYAVTAAEVGRAITADIPRAQLEGLAEGTVITVQASVTFNGSANEADARLFPTRTYTLKVSDPLSIDPTRVTLAPGQTYQRSASGGRPPYRYSTVDPSILITLDPNNGVVQAIAAGLDVVIVKDTTDATAVYPVTVSGTGPGPDPGVTETFESLPEQSWTSIDRPALTVGGRNISTVRNQSSPPILQGVSVYAWGNSGSGQWSLTITPKTPCRTFKAGVYYRVSTGTAGILVHFTDNTYVPLNVAANSAQWVEYTAPQGKLIKYVRLDPQNAVTTFGVWVDNVTLTP
jgi:hypothetical protein